IWAGENLSVRRAGRFAKELRQSVGSGPRTSGPERARWRPVRVFEPASQPDQAVVLGPGWSGHLAKTIGAWNVHRAVLRAGAALDHVVTIAIGAAPRWSGSDHHASFAPLSARLIDQFTEILKKSWLGDSSREVFAPIMLSP